MKIPLSIKEICLYSILGALMFVFQVLLASLPNIEVVSLMTIVIAVVFGWKGLYSVFLFVLLEYVIWGIGLWSACYLYVWPMLFAAAMLCRNMKSPLGWALLGCIFGLLFGALCSLVYFITGGWSAGVSWWISGIPFDLIHGISNFFVILLLFKPCRKVLTLCKEKLLGK